MIENGASVNGVTVVPLNVGMEATQRKIGEDEAMTEELIQRVEKKEREKKVRNFLYYIVQLNI